MWTQYGKRERSAYGIWVRTGERKRPFVRTSFRRVYNIKMVINKYVKKKLRDLNGYCCVLLFLL